MTNSKLRNCLGAAALVGLVAGVAAADNIEVIYSKLAGHPTANIPGVLDLAGNPAVSDWRAQEDFSVSPNGRYWVLKGRTQLGSDLETILVLGSGTSGTMFAQEGQPFIGANPDELYDFFDSPTPASFDTQGNFAFSARARGGATNDNEKIVYVTSGGTQTVIIEQNQPALGLIDVPANPTGDELFGNSMNSISILETPELVQFVNTPITNLHSSRYPALFRGNTSFRQSGVSVIDGEIWDTFDLSDSGCTPDGQHWYAEGDTENPNTAVDDILAVNDVAVLREGSPVDGPGSPIYADIFQTQMVSNGHWITRGGAPGGDDWVVHNGSLIVKTGDPITVGSSEHWGQVFGAVALNRLGDWVLIGDTDSGDQASNYVLVLNGTHVLAREGDPVDLDGNGQFDDDAFIGRGNNTLAPFAANDIFLTDRRVVYFIAQLRNSAGQDLTSVPVFGTPDAFSRIQFCVGDIDRSLSVDLPDVSLLLAAFGTVDGDPDYNELADLDDSGAVDLTDVALILANYGNDCN